MAKSGLHFISLVGVVCCARRAGKHMLMSPRWLCSEYTVKVANAVAIIVLIVFSCMIAY